LRAVAVIRDLLVSVFGSFDSELRLHEEVLDIVIVVALVWARARLARAAKALLLVMEYDRCEAGSFISAVESVSEERLEASFVSS
jgi:hypothetical protein